MAENIKDVRALRRGLAILDILARHGPGRLSDVARKAQIPKSTTRRMLSALENAGYVRRTLGDDLFRSNIAAPGQSVSPPNRSAGRIVHAARPVLEALSKEVVWPSDVFVRDGLELQVIETTRPLTPLLVNRNQIGERVDMVTTAVGRAYLAYCPEAERREVLQGLGVSRRDLDTLGLAAIIEETRRVGFAVRDPRCTWATELNPHLNDRLYAIAVPVMAGATVICCLNMLWPVAAAASVGPEAAMARLLQSKAEDIADNLRKQVS